MRKRIIDWIFTLQSQRGILGEKERRLYTYAYGLLLNKIAIYAIIAIVGTITGNWIGMFSFLLPFTILRQYAGGIHLEKPMNCIRSIFRISLCPAAICRVRAMQIAVSVRRFCLRSGSRHRENIMCFVGCCDFTYIRVGTNRY